MYGEYPPETPSVNCYWENTYDRLDGKYSASDAFMTSYWSFARASASWLHDKYIEMLPRKIFGNSKKNEEKLFSECQLSVNDAVSVSATIDLTLNFVPKIQIYKISIKLF